MRALTTVGARDIRPAIRPPRLGFASSVLATVIVERSMYPGWLSNAYLVADEPGGVCVFVDSGAPLEPLLRVVEAESLTPTHLLLTHGHADHVAGNDRLVERFGI